MPGEKGESPLFCQPPPGRPSQRAQPVPQYHGAVDGCPPQDFGPCIPLHVAGTRRPPQTDSSSPLHVGCNLVFAALRWGLSPLLLITPVLSNTPGMACSLTRGNVTLPPLERYLNWVPETTPTLPRDHGKENLPLVEEPRKLPRK